jgi:hypothetical protein
VAKLSTRSAGCGGCKEAVAMEWAAVLTYTTPLNVDNCGCEDVVGAAIADVFRAVRVLVIVASPNIDCDC